MRFGTMKLIHNDTPAAAIQRLHAHRLELAYSRTQRDLLALLALCSELRMSLERLRDQPRKPEPIGEAE